MKRTTRRLLTLLAALGLLAGSLSNAIAEPDETVQEEPAADGAEPAADGEESAADGGDAAADGGDAADGDGTIAATLTEAELDYAVIAGTVACYNERINEQDKATAAITNYLSVEGLDLDQYQAMEREYRGNANVQGAIKEEMALCPTRVLLMPEETAAETPPEDPEEDVFSYSRRRYKANVSGSGVTGGRLMFVFNRGGTTANGNLSGSISGRRFTVGFAGRRNRDSISLSGGSGNNTARVTGTFDGDTFRGQFTGRVNGRNVNLSFTAKSR